MRHITTQIAVAALFCLAPLAFGKSVELERYPHPTRSGVEEAYFVVGDRLCRTVCAPTDPGCESELQQATRQELVTFLARKGVSNPSDRVQGIFTALRQGQLMPEDVRETVGRGLQNRYNHRGIQGAHHCRVADGSLAVQGKKPMTEPFTAALTDNEHLTLSDIDTYIQQLGKTLRSVDDFVSILPASIWDDPAILTESRANCGEAVSEPAPRVLLHDPVSKLIIAYQGIQSSGCDQSVEIMQKDGTRENPQYRLRNIRFTRAKGAQFASTAVCEGCHAGETKGSEQARITPIWDIQSPLPPRDLIVGGEAFSSSSWPGAVSFLKQGKETSEELARIHSDGQRLTRYRLLWSRVDFKSFGGGVASLDALFRRPGSFDSSNTGALDPKLFSSP